MAVIHEIQQLITCDTPFGEAQALFIMDYGIHRNTIWVCASFKDGKIRHFDSNQITITRNDTLEFNTKNKWDKLNEEFDNALNSMTNDDWDKIKMKNSMKAKLYKTEKENYMLVDPTKGTYDKGYLLGTSRESDVNKLSVKNCQAIERGYDLEEEMYKLVDKKAEQNNTIDLNAYGHGCLDAFQKALEVNADKRFTLKDMMDCWNKALKFQEHKETLGEHIKSLKQTEWDVEIEKENVMNDYNGNIILGASYKLDADGCLILKRI